MFKLSRCNLYKIKLQNSILNIDLMKFCIRSTEILSIIFLYLIYLRWLLTYTQKVKISVYIQAKVLLFQKNKGYRTLWLCCTHENKKCRYSNNMFCKFLFDLRFPDTKTSSLEICRVVCLSSYLELDYLNLIRRLLWETKHLGKSF